MTAIAKTKKPQAVAAAQGSGIRLIHSQGNSDMSSVAQAASTTTSSASLRDKMEDIYRLASAGSAISEVLSLTSTIKGVGTESMQECICDLNSKFDEIIKVITDAA